MDFVDLLCYLCRIPLNDMNSVEVTRWRGYAKKALLAESHDSLEHAIRWIFSHYKEPCNPYWYEQIKGAAYPMAMVAAKASDLVAFVENEKTKLRRIDEREMEKEAAKNSAATFEIEIEDEELDDEENDRPIAAH